MIGSGVLSLSAGVAAFTRAPEGLALAIAMLVGMTAVAACTFQMVVWVSAETGARDFGEAWSASVGEGSAWVPRFAVCAIAGVSAVIYTMLMGDLLTSILRGVLASIGSGGGLLATWRDALLPWCQRGPVLVTLAVTVLFPLCLAENLGNLTITSYVGLAAAFYLSGFVLWRSLDGSYLPGGRFFSIMPMRPGALVAAQSLADVVNLKCLVLLSNIGMSYMNHGIAPVAYQELSPGPDAPAEAEAVRAAKLRRSRLVSALGFLIAGTICMTVMVAGFKTFGPSSAGNLLLNYAHTDFAASLARASVMVSVLFGFPLNVVVLQAELRGALAAAGRPVGAQGRRLMAGGLLTTFVFFALVLGDLGQVQAVCGSTLGSFIVYVAPALMARSLRRKRGGQGSWAQSAVDGAVLALGLVVGCVGLAVSLRPR